MPNIKIDIAKIDKSSQIREDGNNLIIENVQIARIGIQPYGGKNEFRSHEEVMSEQHLKSIESIPITEFHPKVTGQLLNDTNREAHSVGQVRNVRAGETHILGDLYITNKITQQKLRDGKFREVSMGYISKDIKKNGIFDGVNYDSIQTNLRANHCALLPIDSARCGETCRFKVDSKTKKAGVVIFLLMG